MPLNGANPHDTVLPDFTSDKHTDTCLTLTETGLLEDQAIATLSRLWTLNNEKEKFQWDWLIAEEAHTTDAACQLMEAAEALLRQQEQAEKDVPLKPITQPTKYALKQMENANYVELYYFTNQGIVDAKEVAMAPSDGTYVWKQQEDGTNTIQPCILDGFCTLTQTIYARYWECKSEISHQSKNSTTTLLLSSSSKSSASSSESKGKSKEKDNKSKGSDNKNKSSSSSFSISKSATSDAPSHLMKDGKLAEEECQWHIKKKLCMFCSQPGHMVKDCPKSTSKSTKTKARAVKVKTPATAESKR
ncbi:hypothetical protein SCLCIDRAFT_25609 [Scleroderma citrinum Foug A]|uniref:CCHC-type domain-containing protein n=1 Tax=Scleroderma citrinum Foug A TaxID=1036808 RepID=A0A0C3DZX2_9AGAM|nr:hypothetical protein SCLCIDRAFT_25609 [Scleroderma citrinum Foug A]